MVCKIFFCSEFPVIPEKWKKEEEEAMTKRFLFQANAAILLLFKIFAG